MQDSLTNIGGEIVRDSGCWVIRGFPLGLFAERDYLNDMERRGFRNWMGGLDASVLADMIDGLHGGVFDGSMIEFHPRSVMGLSPHFVITTGWNKPGYHKEVFVGFSDALRYLGRMLGVDHRVFMSGMRISFRYAKGPSSMEVRFPCP